MSYKSKSFPELLQLQTYQIICISEKAHYKPFAVQSASHHILSDNFLTSSHPTTYHVRKKASSLLTAISFQVDVERNKVSPKPSLL